VCFIYGPAEMSVEQVASTGKVLYLHHDQQGSTRLMTSATGTTEASYTYDAYGNETGHTGTTFSSLGYDAQYTSADTGLIYMRARTYDPATAQFLSVDPAVALTREPYAYGGDNPVNRRDPDGLSAEGLEGVPCYFPFCGPPPPAVEGVQHGIEGITHGIESVWNSVNENEGPNDEGEAELKEREQENTDCTANRIANGHAFEKHAGEFGAETPEELERTIEDVLENATQSRELSNGRTGYYDEDTNTVVIVDPSSPDGGTIFRPSGGEEYFNGLR
jgi:RHS repeat-associated protein